MSEQPKRRTIAEVWAEFLERIEVNPEYYLTPEALEEMRGEGRAHAPEHQQPGRQGQAPRDIEG